VDQGRVQCEAVANSVMSHRFHKIQDISCSAKRLPAS
jgi:hypothetical protein